MRKPISVVIASALLAGCVDAATIQKINEPWAEADKKANELVTPQLAEECKQKILSKTDVKAQLAPFTSNIKINQLLAGRITMLPFTEHRMINAFVLYGTFSYMFFGAERSGRYGCSYLNKGDHLEFLGVMDPSSFQVTTYISM